MASALVTTLAAICTSPEESTPSAESTFSTSNEETTTVDKSAKSSTATTKTTKGSSAASEAAKEECRWRRRGHGLPIHSFNHISKETENVEEMITFYTKVMGFRRIKRPPFPFAGAWLFMPPSTSLHIIEKDPSIDLPEGPCSAIKKMGSNWKEFVKNPANLKRAGHHMAFRTEDLAGTRELLREYGIGFAENVIPLTGQRQLFFFDPDGNGIEICECDVEPPPFEDEDESISEEEVEETQSSNGASSSQQK